MGNIDLEDYSPEELEALEEKVRDTRKQKETEQKKPEPVENPKMPESVVRMCVRYVDELDEKGIADRDTPGYVFEDVMKAVYADDDIWDWINEQ